MVRDRRQAGRAVLHFGALVETSEGGFDGGDAIVQGGTEVIDLLTETAASHPKVIDDPAPEALLKEFGADALLFDLGFSTEDIAHFPAIQSDVAVAVNAALREAGVEIPFPQRSVHLEGITSSAANSDDAPEKIAR